MDEGTYEELLNLVGLSLILRILVTFNSFSETCGEKTRFLNII